MQARVRGLARTPLLILAPCLAGCGLGTAGVVAASGGNSSGNAPPTIGSLRVDGAKVSPATLRFVLADPESDPATVEFSYTAPGKRRTVLAHLAANPSTLETSSEGIQYALSWNFASEADLPSDASFLDEVELRADVRGGKPEVIEVGLGNDAPVILAAPGPALAEVDGVVPLPFTVEDSSSDLVSVRIEYDIVGDQPDAGWQTARPGGLKPSDPTPEFAFQGQEALPDTGTDLVFFWDTDVDLARLDHDVLVRFTAVDPIVEGVPVETPRFRVDNNEEPIVQIEEGAFLINPDERRGIPIPYRVIDEESDPVRVVFQWRREGEAFPTLPSDPAAVEAILRDPERGRRKRICTPYPAFARGRVEPVDASHVRLPELAGVEARLLARGVEGLRIELLRASAVPAPIAASWATNPLEAPVVALPVAGGTTALVLEGSAVREPGGPGAGVWRLREIELATGTIVREVAAATSGNPSAMAFEPGARSLLVAADLGGLWRVDRVDLESGTVVPLVNADGDSERGPIRGLASLGSHAALATVGDALVRLDWSDPDEPRAANVLDGLATPWGIALDPLRAVRAYVAERDAASAEGPGRVVTVDLDTHAVRPVLARAPRSGQAAFPRPTALALERSGTRLVALCYPGPTDRCELRGVQLGRSAEVEVFALTELPSDAASLATGPETLRLVALPGSADLAIGGGVEQTREIAGYDTATRTIHASEPFVPLSRALQTWRIRQHPFFDPLDSTPEGTSGTFVWNSEDVPGGGSVFLGAHAFDAEGGLPATTSVARRVASGLAVAPVEYGSALTTRLPASVTAGDLDGDGDLDLACANEDGHDLAVFFQDTPGSFDPVPLKLGRFGLTDSPAAVAAADLDGDGDLDLVSANSGGDDLTIFFQSAPGSFDPAPTSLGGPGITGSPHSVAAADLDGDGDLDLASANYGSHTLTVFFQTAPAAFDPTPLTLGGIGTTTFPIAVAAADLDRDGDLDLVSGNHRGDNLTVFFQSARGGFDPVSRVLGGPGITDFPRSVTAADIDGDGGLDLVSGNEGNLAVFFQPSGGFLDRREPDVVLSLPDVVLLGAETGDTSEFVAAADLDGDGDLDIVSANRYSTNLTAYFQNAPASFDPIPLALGGPGITDSPRSVAAADFDGNGALDLVSANGLNLTVFPQNTPGTFDPSPLTLEVSGAADRPGSAAAADFDGDGDLDLVSANRVNLTIYSQNTPGSFDPDPVVIGASEITPSPTGATAADIDGDGDLDLISGSCDRNDLTVFFQNGQGSFGPDPLVLSGAVCPGAVGAADFDGDGDLDLVSANRANLRILFQNAPGSFDSRRLTLRGSGDIVAAADLDGDGDLDLASASRSTSNVTIFFQGADGFVDRSLPDVLLGGPGTTESPSAVAAADLDGDGDLDLLSANYGTRNLTAFLQITPGIFERDPVTLGGLGITDFPVDVGAADLDGDGDTDVVSANQFNLTTFFQRTPGVFDPDPLTLGGAGTTNSPGSVALADLDGDGDMDVVSAFPFDDNLKVFWGGR